MVTTLTRNGTGARKTAPRRPLLLESTPLPFSGDYAQFTINYNVDAVLALLDHEAAGLHALNAEYEAQEEAIRAEIQPQLDALTADESLLLSARKARLAEITHELNERRSPLWLAEALNVIRAVVDSVTWPYEEAPPDPQHPETWGWHDPILTWIGGAGFYLVGAQWGGPLAQQVEQLQSWSITASLMRKLNGS